MTLKRLTNSGLCGPCCCCWTLTAFCLLQNGTEKSASEPGTPPQTSKPADLRPASKSPKSSLKTPPTTPKSEVSRSRACVRHMSLFLTLLPYLLSTSSRQLLRQFQHQRSDAQARMVT